MSEHTPGPWHWMEEKLNDRLAHRLGKTRSQLTKRDGDLLYALVGPPSGDPDAPDKNRDVNDYWHIMVLPWQKFKGSIAFNVSPKPADRALIAAAPDLLEACEDALDEAGHLSVHTLRKIEAAIAKAKGTTCPK